jgi:hypothetical protein
MPIEELERATRPEFGNEAIENAAEMFGVSTTISSRDFEPTCPPLGLHLFPTGLYSRLGSPV